MAALESSMPSSMLISMICAPPSTCCRATDRAPLIITGQNQFCESRRAGHVRPFADVDEIRFRPNRDGFKTAQPGVWLDLRRRAWGFTPRTASAMRLIWAGVVPQQPPTIFSHPFSAHSLN